MDMIVRFTFSGEVDADGVEADIALAIFTAECVYGKPRARMEASYLVEDDVCVVRVGGDAGETAVRVFVGLTSARFGEDSFTVRRLRPAESGEEVMAGA